MELHLCEDHAREYLNSSSAKGGEAGQTLAATLSKGMSKSKSLSKAADELKEIDTQTCPICGTSFYDFRTRGRLGCPNDYSCFSEQLEPLILSIHGETSHTGKRPNHFDTGVQQRQSNELIKLHRDLEAAIAKEDYAQASVLRDKIRALET